MEARDPLLVLGPTSPLGLVSTQVQDSQRQDLVFLQAFLSIRSQVQGLKQHRQDLVCLLVFLSIRSQVQDLSRQQMELLDQIYLQEFR